MGLFGKLFGGSSDVQGDFWRWFSDNSDRLAQVKTCQEPVAADLAKQLSKVRKGLVFLFGPTEDGRREFIVSADGIRERFPDVTQLVDAAPDIPGWKIIAFRPPMKDLSGLSLTLGNVKLEPNDIWFTARPSGAHYNLDVFIRELPGVTKEVLGQGAFLLMDSAIGEYNVATKIGEIAFDHLPLDPVAMGLKPLTELPNAII